MTELSNPGLTGQIVYEGVFKPDECNKILSLVNPQNRIGLPGNINSFKIEKNGFNEWIWERFIKCTFHASKKYYKFNISHLESLQILEYSEKSLSEWLIDLDENFLNRKISVIGFLSEKRDYAGGQLHFDVVEKSDSQLIPMSPGAVVIFPSYQVYKVQPVSRGIKYSISGIFYGDAFC